MAVLIETSLGDITVDLFTEERPRSTLNFLKLCKIKYYNFCLFHSVQRNLVAQTGDPTGTGRGGQSVFASMYGEQAIYFDMETVPRIKHKQKGLVSLVNNGNNGHGSQFFFTLGEDLDYLDGVHTVIGEVSEGEDVLNKINEVYCDEQHRPYKDIRIYHTILLDDPFDDPDGLVVPDKSPEPTKQQLDSGRIGVDEDIDDTEGLTEQEIQDALDKKEAEANAQILEMVGDLPDADVRPPDTVLFVCKLNPVTTSEDLEIIFSRFGKILSCEVIKDQKSEESLQYAFIEFDKPEDCESAYFKMDNVLIDDRRIHVDFSQSVSKLQHPGGKEEIKAGLFGPQYKIKDTSKKNTSKYDLVFADDNSKRQHKNEKPERKEDKKRHKSRSPSPENVRRNKKPRDSGSRGHYRDREDNFSDRDNSYNKESVKKSDKREKEKQRSSSKESVDDERQHNSRKYKSNRDKRERDSSSSESEFFHRKSNLNSKSSKRPEHKKYHDSDSDSRSRAKMKKQQSRSPSISSSEERSKKKNSKSHKKKHKTRDRSPDSENETEKYRRTKGRERSERNASNRDDYSDDDRSKRKQYEQRDTNRKSHKSRR